MDNAKLLLTEMENEADIFQIETVPGVVALAWESIRQPLGSKVKLLRLLLMQPVSQLI